MKKGTIDHTKVQSRVATLKQFYQRKGRMPSFSEMAQLFRLRSKGAVAKVVDQMEKQGVLRRDSTGRLIPRSVNHSLRVLGAVEAGFPSPAEEEIADTLSLDDLLIENREATFLLRVSGDSMNDAGILPGDMVLVDRGRTPESGDIVVAEVDGQWTMKYLRKRGESVTLVPANARYKPIRPQRELKIAGVVTGVVRKYK
ncbi:MAG: repressor LexA [Armatimonadetes bacterium]|nr:repressor LexA [Armatimonadota bacterium]